MTKVEDRKKNVIDELHNQVVNDLLCDNDVVFFGDINSHDIVKKGKNRILNRNINDLEIVEQGQINW
jgi:hypothetical protein